MAHPHESTRTGSRSAPLPATSEATGTGPDAYGPRLASVVLFVHDHDESADFYQELLKMEVTVRTTTAALPVGQGGFHV